MLLQSLRPPNLPIPTHTPTLAQRSPKLSAEERERRTRLLVQSDALEAMAYEALGVWSSAEDIFAAADALQSSPEWRSAYRDLQADVWVALRSAEFQNPTAHKVELTLRSIWGRAHDVLLEATAGRLQAHAEAASGARAKTQPERVDVRDSDQARRGCMERFDRYLAWVDEVTRTFVLPPDYCDAVLSFALTDVYFMAASCGSKQDDPPDVLWMGHLLRGCYDGVGAALRLMALDDGAGLDAAALRSLGLEPFNKADIQEDTERITRAIEARFDRATRQRVAAQVRGETH